MLDPRNLHPGNEQYEVFFTGVGRNQKKMVQYDYRDGAGELFSCTGKTLAACREKRDRWQAARDGN